MCKWIITIIFINLMAIIYAPRPKYWRDSQITSKEKAEEHFDEIDPLGALPVVLFEIRDYVFQLRPPEYMARAATLNKKMVKGADLFILTGSKKCIFFCPKPDSESDVTPESLSMPSELCLVPVEFEESQELRCTKEPTPVTRQSVYSECAYGNGTSYSVAYEICNKPHGGMYRYENLSVLLLFQFCYHKDNNETVFTTHLIISPLLLATKLLHREQNVDYDYFFIRPLETQHSQLINRAINLGENPMYRVQKLVPSEDMAMATWRKPTFQYDNLEFQHWLLFDIWNEINATVRKEVIRIYETNVRFVFHTGVVGNRLPGPDQQMHNKWVKIIAAERKDNRVQEAGVAILMNNFINVGGYIQSDLEEFCVDDLCSDYFKSRIASVGGQMRCCRITRKIRELFGVELHPYLEYRVLQIPDLIIQT